MRAAHRLIAGLAVVAVLAVAAGCGETDKPAGVSTPGSGGAVTNATFTYGAFTPVLVGWDPSTDYSNEIIAMNNMYETLTRYNSETGEVEPLLATEWQRSSDGKTWTFTIREGVTFHTGRPMTAADVKASVERTMKINEGAAYIWAAVDTIEAPDPTTVVFNLKYPASLDLIASSGYAAFVFDTEAAPAKQLTKWFEQGNDAGTGPYTVDEWNEGQEVELRLKQFPEYWGGWEGSKYTNVVFRVVPTPNTTAQLVRSGEVTWAEQLTPQLWESLKSDGNLVTTSSNSYQNLFGMLNTSFGPLKDVRVRQALAYATDYEGIIAALQSFQPATGVIPEGLWGHNPDLPVYGTDIEKAKDLLGQAGYGPDGQPMKLTLTYTQGDQYESTVATLLKSQYADLNIDLQVQALQWPTQWSKAKSTDPSKRQDMLLFYWWPDYPDPYSWFVNMFKSGEPPYFNLAYYDNPEVDRMITEVDPLSATDRDAAIDMYTDIQTKLLEDSPALFLGVQTYQRAMQKSVEGYVDNPAYPNVVFVHSLTPTA